MTPKMYIKDASKFKNKKLILNKSTNKTSSDAAISRAESFKGYYGGYSNHNKVLFEMPLSGGRVVCKFVSYTV